MKLPETLRALRYRNFRLFFAGQLISLIGTWMQSIAQAWLVYRLTGSSVLLGAVGFTGQIPMFLFAPLAGIAADRYNRRRVVITTQTTAMLLAFALAALTFTGQVRIWHIFTLSALLGVANAFDFPARHSLFVEMVGRTDLMNAIALNSSIMTASRIVGPAIAGIVVAVIGEAWCFFANGISFVAVLIGLMLMRLEPGERAHSASPLNHFREGFHYVAGTPPVPAILILLGVISLTASPYSVLMPIFADRVLHRGAEALGSLMGSAGIGALFGALLLASRKEVVGLVQWMALCCVMAGVSLVAFALSRVFWLSAVMLVPVGFALTMLMGASNTLVQSIVPDRLRGRVMSFHSMMFLGMMPFGALLAGAISGGLGAPVTVASGGLCALAAVTIFSLLLPRIQSQVRALLQARALETHELSSELAGAERHTAA